MDIDQLLPITTRGELRAWLEKYHRTASSCWIPITRKPSPHAVLYLSLIHI